MGKRKFCGNGTERQGDDRVRGAISAPRCLNVPRPRPIGPLAMQSRRSVLVVDRDPNFRRNAGRFLRDRGFEVVDAAHPSLGLALVESEAPTFVLLDLDTTDPAGLEVLESM